MKIAKGNSSSSRGRIEQAIRDMSDAGCLMTISGVAKEAGVHNSTIHNRYKDLAVQIKEMKNKASLLGQQKASSKRKGKVTTTKQRIQTLRSEVASWKEKFAKSNSINASLDQRNQSLEAENEYLKSKL